MSLTSQSLSGTAVFSGGHVKLSLEEAVKVGKIGESALFRNPQNRFFCLGKIFGRDGQAVVIQVFGKGHIHILLKKTA